MPDLRTVINSFTTKLAAFIEGEVMERTRAAVLGSVGAPPRRGRPPKAWTLTEPTKVRKKAPPQYCPVPGCKNLAAPIFGMVCAKHKDVAKSKIKKYREARRAKKAKAAA